MRLFSYIRSHQQAKQSLLVRKKIFRRNINNHYVTPKITIWAAIFFRGMIEYLCTWTTFGSFILMITGGSNHIILTKKRPKFGFKFVILCRNFTKIDQSLLTTHRSIFLHFKVTTVTKVYYTVGKFECLTIIRSLSKVWPTWKTGSLKKRTSG